MAMAEAAKAKIAISRIEVTTDSSFQVSIKLAGNLPRFPPACKSYLQTWPRIA